MRILVVDLDVNMGVAAYGKLRIMIRTNCLPSQDVDLVKSLLAFTPGAIDTITPESIREITHVEKRVPLKP